MNLKPCPFCGAENPVVWKVPKNMLYIDCMEVKQPARWHIYCVSCSATIMEEKKRDAIRNWNRRAEVKGDG